MDLGQSGTGVMDSGKADHSGFERLGFYFPVSLRTCLLLLGFCLLGLSSGWGETILTGDAEARPGTRVLLKIRLPESTIPCSGMNARLFLPPQIEATQVLKGDLLADDTFKLYSHSEGRSVSFLAYSKTGAFSGPGTLVTLELYVSTAALDGNYAIAFYDNSQDLVNWQALAPADGTASLLPLGIDGNLTVNNSASALNAWLAGYFSQAEINAWPDSMKADPDRDFRSNIVEYLFGGNPRVFEFASPFEAVELSAGVYTFSGMVRSDDPTLEYTLEFSGDLRQWERHTLNYNAGQWETPGSSIEIEASLIDESGVWILYMEVPAIETYRFSRISCEP